MEYVIGVPGSKQNCIYDLRGASDLKTQALRWIISSFTFIEHWPIAIRRFFLYLQFFGCGEHKKSLCSFKWKPKRAMKNEWCIRAVNTCSCFVQRSRCYWETSRSACKAHKAIRRNAEDWDMMDDYRTIFYFRD